ncbi:hypothetical protein C1645_837981, partial [Glomus cerebriforme]
NDNDCVVVERNTLRHLFVIRKNITKVVYHINITDITDNDTYLDVYYTIKLECDEYEISRIKELQTIQECC